MTLTSLALQEMLNNNTKNVKLSALSEEENAKTHNKKNMKENISLVKAIYSKDSGQTI